MANAVHFACVNSIVHPNKPSIPTSVPFLKSKLSFQNPKPDSCCRSNSNVRPLNAKTPDSNQGTKTNSLVCAECDGNGAKLCTQCEGTGVNSVDKFNGQFKAGGLCWLCRGKREILCGNCNGAGFLGGFMSTFED